jgi:glucosylceramidase
MPGESTRRTFLKMSAIGLAAARAGRDPMVDSGTASGPASGELEVWVTNQKMRCARGETISWRTSPAVPAGDVITLDPKTQFQTALGFGAAFTDASCYIFNQLAPAARAQLFHELFHPSELGLSVCRTCIGSSDYSTQVYSYDEGAPDPDLKRFSIAHDREYILPMLRQARQMNPDLFLFASPWSPPGWMKSGGSMLGGSMRRRYLSNYAQYFRKFLQAYAAAGVPIQAVTPQNEVDTDQDARMPACIWPQEYEIEFVGHHLGPLLAQNGIATKIWILDHNYNLWGRAVCELDDAGVRKYCNAVAWHGYAGSPEMMSRAHDTHPDAEMYWTEGGPDYSSPDYQTDWVRWGQTFTAALRNWCRAITGWNLALDERGRPNIGPFPCGGLVTVHSQTREIIRSGQYWAFAHFSRTIRRGARRFDSRCSASDLDHVAFENPGGQRVLVMTNAGPARKATLQIGGLTSEVSLENNSVVTCTWL